MEKNIGNTTLLEDLFKAYFDARRNKRNTHNQLAFEMKLEENIMKLYEEIRTKTYVPSPSVCFIVHRPVKREIFASQFRDRVVHHLLYNYIAPIFEKKLIYDCYSCRVGKGTSFGIERLKHHIRSCTRNYTLNAYVLKLDLKGYFMSIDKQKLYGIISGKLSRHWQQRSPDGRLWGDLYDTALIDYLLQKIIFKDPAANAVRKSDIRHWSDLPANKSLLKSPKGVGLPIGDLTSQLFSNIYMGVFDDYIKKKLKVRHYGRYVDDFFIVHTDKHYLKELIGHIRDYLRDKLALTLHPDKIYLQNVRHGVHFLGAVVKPHRCYASNRSVKQFNKTVDMIDRKCKAQHISPKMIFFYMASLNSYCGYLKQYKTLKTVSGKLENAHGIARHFQPVNNYSKMKYMGDQKKKYMNLIQSEKAFNMMLEG